MSWSRRKLLTSSALSVSFIAGCGEFPLANDDISCRDLPEDPPTPPSCPDDDFVRFEQQFSENRLEYGESDQPTFHFRFSIDEREIAIGDTFEVALENVGDEQAEMGPFTQHDIQLYASEGWWNVRGYPRGQRRPIPGELYIWEPGQRRTWTFEASRDGLTDEDLNHVVCPDLLPGRYRLVFWGLPGDRAIGVCFDLVDGD